MKHNEQYYFESFWISNLEMGSKIWACTTAALKKETDNKLAYLIDTKQMEQTQVVLSPHSQHFQSHRQAGELPRADLQSYHHIWHFHWDFLNAHRPKEGLQRTRYMKLRCYRDCRAGTENTVNASGKNYLKYLKYLKANVTNTDTQPLQGFGQYAIPSHSWEEWEEGPAGTKTPKFKYHLCNHTLLSPLSSWSASFQRGKPAQEDNQGQK